MLSVLLRGLQCEADYYLYKSQDIFSDVMCIHHSPFTPKTNKVIGLLQSVCNHIISANK